MVVCGTSVDSLAKHSAYDFCSAGEFCFILLSCVGLADEKEIEGGLQKVVCYIFHLPWVRDMGQYRQWNGFLFSHI